MLIHKFSNFWTKMREPNHVVFQILRKIKDFKKSVIDQFVIPFGITDSLFDITNSVFSPPIRKKYFRSVANVIMIFLENVQCVSNMTIRYSLFSLSACALRGRFHAMRGYSSLSQNSWSEWMSSYLRRTVFWLGYSVVKNCSLLRCVGLLRSI